MNIASSRFMKIFLKATVLAVMLLSQPSFAETKLYNTKFSPACDICQDSCNTANANCQSSCAESNKNCQISCGKNQPCLATCTNESQTCVSQCANKRGTCMSSCASCK